jgi:hypothetical protein
MGNMGTLLWYPRYFSSKITGKGHIMKDGLGRDYWRK